MSSGVQSSALNPTSNAYQLYHLGMLPVLTAIPILHLSRMGRALGTQ